MFECSSERTALALLVILALLLPMPSAAQIVRGVVTNETAGDAARGAIVTLERVTRTAAGEVTAEVRSVLVDLAGTYVLSGPAPGAYQVVVRRIGSQPHRSAVFNLAAGETRRLDVALSPIQPGSRSAVVLRAVNITRATPCRGDTDDGARIASLWEDARTALNATEISRRDSLVMRRLVRYTRQLDPSSLEVEKETLQAFDGAGASAPLFNSLPADSLSKVGYWREVSPTVTTFYGLDASALLSETFVADHCFRLVEGTDSRLGMTGLVFEPIPIRTRPSSPPEIHGNIWLDSTSALQLVEFGWTRLPARASAAHLGGQVHFARLDDGPWYVRSWRLRIPQDFIVMRGGRVENIRREGIVEEGGIVQEDVIDSTRVPAEIAGVVQNTGGRGLAGAVVRVVGTSLRVVTGPDGRFVLDRVPPGLQFVVVDHDMFAGLGIRLGEQQLLLDDGSRRELSFRASQPEVVMRTLCGDAVDVRDRAMLRVTLSDSASGQPLAGVRMRLARQDSQRRPPYDVSDETNADGVITFCDVPASHAVVLSAPGLAGQVLEAVTFDRGSVNARAVRVRRP